MGRAPFPHLVALLCGFLAAAAVGCGADRSNLIPSQRASDLTSQLDAIKADIDAGRCDGLTAKLTAFHDDATGLTKPVDSRLRKRINDGVKSLQAHALRDCQAAAQAKTQTQTTDTTQTQTQTTDTTTTETQTATTPTETQTSTTPTDTTPTTTPSSATPPTDTGTSPSDNGGTPGAEVLP